MTRFLLIYYFCKLFPDDFMVSVAVLKPSLRQHAVHLVNYYLH